MKLFGKNKQDNSLQSMAQELATHAVNGGTAGVKIAINNMLYVEVYNWAKKRKEKGEIINKEVLLAKMNKVFLGSRFARAYSNIQGYNEKTINELADQVLANI